MAIFNEEYIEEYQSIQEMHFSKSDLQDPATIDRIIKARENFESTLKFTNYLFLALSIIGNIIISGKAKDAGIGGSFIALSIIDIILAKKIGGAVESLPKKQYEKNINKYKDQINKLIIKMEKAKKNDPKNADKYQKTIDNCKKVLADFDRRDKEIAKMKLDNEVDDIISEYEDLIGWKKDISTIGHTGNGKDFRMFYLASIYGINESDIIKYAVAHGEKVSAKEMHEYINGGEEGNCEIEKDFNNSDCIFFSSDDEVTSFIICNNNKFYITYDGDKYESASIYSIGKEYWDFSKEALEEFDKEKGFYKFTKCPDNVKANKFISFK